MVREKENKNMSKYRFAGTVKCVEIQSKSLIFSFIPDSEYSSVLRKDKDETMFALIQPVDKKDVGYVFAYENTVKVQSSSTGAHAHITLGIHCMLELDDKLSTSIFAVTFTDLNGGGKKNTFAVTTITVL